MLNYYFIQKPLYRNCTRRKDINDGAFYLEFISYVCFLFVIILKVFFHRLKTLPLAPPLPPQDEIYGGNPASQRREISALPRHQKVHVSILSLSYILQKKFLRKQFSERK